MKFGDEYFKDYKISYYSVSITLDCYCIWIFMSAKDFPTEKLAFTFYGWSQQSIAKNKLYNIEFLMKSKELQLPQGHCCLCWRPTVGMLLMYCMGFKFFYVPLNLLSSSRKVDWLTFSLVIPILLLLYVTMILRSTPLLLYLHVKKDIYSITYCMSMIMLVFLHPLFLSCLWVDG